ncbi:hypothetical protein SUGI_0860630 [Cryptomeria japonica]|nr:hypothetical protein SUGI_0860630 [Cryptomeria japonica]
MQQSEGQGMSLVEGVAQLDGRKPCIWDTYTHSGKMFDGSTGDEDVRLMFKLGLDTYRFSISWSRLIPDGRGAINPKGLEYYNNLINGLILDGNCHMKRAQAYSFIVNPIFSFPNQVNLCYTAMSKRNLGTLYRIKKLRGLLIFTMGGKCLLN